MQVLIVKVMQKVIRNKNDIFQHFKNEVNQKILAEARENEGRK